jgi:hypothetical protein
MDLSRLQRKELSLPVILLPGRPPLLAVLFRLAPRSLLVFAVLLSPPLQAALSPSGLVFEANPPVSPL